MNVFDIKIIAVVTMIIDHIGLYFFPDVIILRMIGRLSFPLFAWLIANGAIHSKNLYLYAKRLFLLAIITQIPYAYANKLFNPLFAEYNVVFTLLLGLVTIIVFQKTKSKIFRIITTILAILLAILLKLDYGVLGILSILTFYLFYKKPTKLVISQVILLLLLPYITIILERLYHADLSTFYYDSYYEFFGLFSLIFIYFYNQKLGHKAKYLFYLFYPLQYVALIIYKLL